MNPALGEAVEAGPLSGLVLDGALRRVSLGGIELIRSIGFTVRDSEWGTASPALTVERRAIGQHAFQVTFAYRVREGELALEGHIDVEGTAAGDLRYTVAATARSEFFYRRIGLLVLHPPSLAGCRATLRSRDSEFSSSLPYLVEPQWRIDGAPRGMWAPFEELDLEVEPGLTLHHVFDGELFEMEDQRNWGDGSFKTYAMPLGVDSPRRARRDMTLRQRLTVSVIGKRSAPMAVPKTMPIRPLVTLSELGEAPGLPAIGLSTGPEPVTGDLAAGFLRGLRCDHLLQRPHDNDAATHSLASALDVPVEVVFDPMSARGARPSVDRPVKHVVTLGPSGEPPSPADIVAARRLFPGARCLVGSDGPFATLNRARPLPAADGIAFPLSPQVHDRDDMSMMESLEAIGPMVETARRLGAGPMIAVGPIGLRPSTAGHSADDAGTDSRQQDSRLPLVWSLGALVAFADYGVASTTWDELSGPRGLIDGAARGGRPRVRPLAALFEDLSGWRRAARLALAVEPAGSIVALALNRASRLQILLGNLQPTHIDVGLKLPQVADMELSTLEVDGAVDLSEWHRTSSPVQSTADEPLVVTLPPFGYLRIRGALASTARRIPN